MALFGPERYSTGKYASVNAWPVFGHISRPSSWWRSSARPGVVFAAGGLSHIRPVFGHIWLFGVSWHYCPTWCLSSNIGPFLRSMGWPSMFCPVEILGRWPSVLVSVAGSWPVETGSPSGILAPVPYRFRPSDGEILA